jgi:chromosomal replication initiator protein
LTTSDREVVAALGQAIAQRIGEPRYNLWFDRNTKFSWRDDLLLVGVPNHFYLDFLQKKFADAVREAASEVLGQPLEVRFVIDPELFQAARRAQTETPTEQTRRGPDAQTRSEEEDTQLPTAERGVEPQKPRGSRSNHTRRWHRLADFVVGSCNRVAHASALNVIESTGEGPNPLVIHGPVGTGKTHLLEGIYAGLRKKHGDWRVCYVSCEEFTNRFVQAMRLGKLTPFRKHYRECDILLVDDLHFLVGKKATQEEFLHTFDALLGEGKQMVVTCDCHPRLGEDFTAELTDRLLGGAVWGLIPPDPETRLNLLRVKSVRGGLPPLPDEVVQFIAAQLRGNVRELEGAINCVRHLARVTERPIDLSLVREALGDLLRHAVRVVQLADVDRAVCAVLRLESGALQSKHRAWQVSHPRMVAMYLARKHTAATYGEIGSYFGGRNHSTAVAAEKKVRGWIEADGELSLGERRIRVRGLVELVEREVQR